MSTEHPPLEVFDEGTSKGKVRKMDFVGSSVSVVVSDNVATITITGGGGSPGPTGPQGSAGLSGLDGQDAEELPSLIPGPVGSRGPVGLTGPMGFDGEQGETGEIGPQGLVGPRGVSIQGAPGFDGSDGDEGAMGLPGPMGQPGAVGSSGSPGAAGASGVPGPPGLDAEEPEIPYVIPGDRGATGPQGPAGGGGSGTVGTAILDFGAFPGSSITNIDVATAGVISTSVVEAWIRPVASADHTVEDHIAVPISIAGQYLSNGNIRIWGKNMNDVQPPLEERIIVVRSTGARVKRANLTRQPAPMLVGTYNAWWSWI